MKKKFKHYATDEIREFEVSNSKVNIDNKVYSIGPFNKDVKIIGTSWVLVKND